MEWLWLQMHRGSVSMPADKLIFEGEHDLSYLYRTGFVDTDKFKYQDWLNAFKNSRQSNGEYHLTKEQWLSKATYRYNKKVEEPYDPMTIREGEWTEADWLDFIKTTLVPQCTITFEQYLFGINEAKRKGEIKDGIVTMTAEKKRGIVKLLNNNPSPKRRRALAVQHVRKKEDLETTASGPSKTSTAAAVAPQETTQYDSGDQQKSTTGKLSDLLSGSKK